CESLPVIFRKSPRAGSRAGPSLIVHAFYQGSVLMRLRTSRLRLLCGTLAPLAAVAGFSFVLFGTPSAQAATGLAAAAEATGRYFGVAYTNAHASDSTYSNIAGTQFDMVTPE